MGSVWMRLSRCAFVLTAFVVLNRSRAANAQFFGVVINESHYTARVEDDVVRIEATLAVQILTKSEVYLPLYFGNAVVEKPADENVKLQGIRDGKYALRFSGEGERKLQLRLTVPLQTDGNKFGLEFQCPSSALTTLDLTVPGAKRTIHLDPFSVPLPLEDSEESSPDRTRIKARFGSTSQIAAHWIIPQPEPPLPDPLVEVQNNLQVLIDDDLIHTSATLSCQIHQGAIEQLQFAVAAGARILDVSGGPSGVLNWDLSSEEKRQLVTVQFPEKISGSTEIEVHTESSVPEGPLEIAGIADDGTVRGIHAVGVQRESGTLMMTDHRTNPTAVLKRKSLLQVGGSEIRKSGAPLRVGQFRFFNPKMQLALAAQQTPQKTEPATGGKTIIEKGLIEISVDDGIGKPTAEYRCRYWIHPGSQQQLGLALPAGAELISIRVDENEVTVRQNEEQEAEAAGSPYVVDLNGLKEGLVTVLFRYPIGPPPFKTRLGKLRLPLPELSLDGQADVSPGQLRAVVRVPERFALIGEPEAFALESPMSFRDVWQSHNGTGQRPEQLDDWIGDRTGRSLVYSQERNAYLYRKAGKTGVLEATWGDMPFAGWALSLPLFLIACVLGRTSWRNKLSVLFLGAFAIALVALEKPDWVFHGLYAARYGLIAVPGWWLIQSLPGVHSQRSQTSQTTSPSGPPSVTPAAVVVPPPGVFESLKSEWSRGKKAAAIL